MPVIIRQYQTSEQSSGAGPEDVFIWNNTV